MKIRTGFVSNSSSSSFIISKPTKEYDVIIPSETRQLPAKRIDDVLELMEWLSEEYCWSYEDEMSFDWLTNEDAVEVFESCMKKLRDGESLFVAVTDNWDEISNFWRNEDVMSINGIEVLYRGAR